MMMLNEVAIGETAKKREFAFWQVSFIVLVMLAITATEYVFAYQNVAYGIVLALALAIAIYVTLSVFHPAERITSCGESLALIPLYILFTASLPWFFINQDYLLPAVYSCILGLAFWHIYRKGISLTALLAFTRRKLPRYVLLGLVLGLPLGVVEYFILRPAPALPAFQVGGLLRDTIYMLAFVGFGEELLFRGLIQRDLAAAFGWKWGLLGSAVLFAVMHLTWRSVPELGFVFIAGLVLGLVYWRTQSLATPIVAHAANNILLVAVLPYLLR